VGLWDAAWQSSASPVLNHGELSSGFAADMLQCGMPLISPFVILKTMSSSTLVLSSSLRGPRVLLAKIALNFRYMAVALALHAFSLRFQLKKAAG
jgi:hypothetical protein